MTTKSSTRVSLGRMHKEKIRLLPFSGQGTSIPCCPFYTRMTLSRSVRIGQRPSLRFQSGNGFKSLLGRKEIILRSNSPWGFYPFQLPNSPKGQVARVSGEQPPCMTRGTSLRPLGHLT